MTPSGRRAVHYAQKQTHSQESIQSANVGRTVIITNYRAEWQGGAKNRDVFTVLCECFCCWQYWPDTFVEDIEFVICQTFLLEDCYYGIVNATTYTQKWSIWLLLIHFNCLFFQILITFTVPVPGGVGSRPLLLLPSVLWWTFLALPQLAETRGAHQLQPVQSPHEWDVEVVVRERKKH